MRRFFLLFILLLPVYLAANIYKLQITGPIDSITEEYITRAFEEIKNDGDARLVIIEIDTPGGFGTSMRAIIKEIMNSPTPVAVYVTPMGARAASAGFLITISADIAAMAPGTNMGAAHPVSALPVSTKPKEDEKGEKKKDVMEEKVTNDAASYAKSLAKSRNRNINLSEAAVRESKSYTAEECLQNNLIEYIVKDLQALIKELDGKEVTRIGGNKTRLDLQGQTIQSIKMTGRQKFLRTISNPTLALVLVFLGLAGLFIEFTHPGIIIPGVLGAIFLILAFMAFQVLPVNYIGLLLILLSIGFFIAEIKIQGFGMFGIGGVISFVLGSVILIKKVPVPEMRPSMTFIIITALAIGSVFFFLAYKVYKAIQHRTETGKEGLIGETGVAKTIITPTEGKVFVHGEWWNAIADREIAQGTKVIVESFDKFVLKVKKI